jgi:hypothetical protein
MLICTSFLSCSGSRCSRWDWASKSQVRRRIGDNPEDTGFSLWRCSQQMEPPKDGQHCDFYLVSFPKSTPIPNDFPLAFFHLALPSGTFLVQVWLIITQILMLNSSTLPLLGDRGSGCFPLTQGNTQLDLQGPSAHLQRRDHRSSEFTAQQYMREKRPKEPKSQETCCRRHGKKKKSHEVWSP